MQKVGEGGLRPRASQVLAQGRFSSRAKNIKNDPNWVQNRPSGLKLGPEACQDRSGAFGTGLTHSKESSPANKKKNVRNGSRIVHLA